MRLYHSHELTKHIEMEIKLANRVSNVSDNTESQVWENKQITMLLMQHSYTRYATQELYPRF
jgi:hypothetical protein